MNELMSFRIAYIMRIRLAYQWYFGKSVNTCSGVLLHPRGPHAATQARGVVAQRRFHNDNFHSCSTLSQRHFHNVLEVPHEMVEVSHVPKLGQISSATFLVSSWVPSGKYISNYSITIPNYALLKLKCCVGRCVFKISCVQPPAYEGLF